MALHRIILNTELTATQDAAIAQFNGTDSWYNAKRLLQWLRGYILGTRNANCLVKVGAVQATGAITSTGASVAAQTITVCNVVLAAVASGANPALGEWNVSATVETQATSIALAINTISTLTGKVTASVNAGVVTVTSVVPGLIGNGLQLSESADNLTVTAFANGTDGTAYNLTLGKVIS